MVVEVYDKMEDTIIMKTLPPTLNRGILYTLIFLSGAAGLIYQVTWHKYLAILLGAQARATAVILAIFLGGISLGYWVFGRWTRWKRWNLLLVYAFVEVGLGFWAFLFPTFFKWSMALSSSMYGWLGLTNLFVDVIFSILLIGLPTFLMGGTLPLLTQGLSEDLERASKTHARIYGFNTVGACVGCLMAGYVLIPTTDLAFTVTFGGLVNVVVALSVYFLYAKDAEPQDVVLPRRKKETDGGPSQDIVALFFIGFCSGFYLIALETVLIRLMGLSTGASNYNFTLIVAIFIMALGVGSLMVREIGKYKFSRLFWNQVIVFSTLFLLYVSGDYWSYWVHVLRVTLRDIPENFFFYQFLLGCFFSALLLVPIGFSGLTLPLCFHLVKDTKEGLGLRVGQLYGLNTLGSVLGALLGGYFFLKFLDLDHLFKLCVFISGLTVAASGFIHFRGKFNRIELGFASAISALVFAGLFIVPGYDHNRNIQPFRHPRPMEVTFSGAKAFGEHLSRHTKILHWDDGPNTSLGVGSTIFRGNEISRTIFVNGKSDGNTKGDYLTTVMLAHIPALLAPSVDNVCVIGFGTGVTIGTLGLYRDIKRVDVVEISEVILKNRHYYDPYNFAVTQNERNHFHEMDAFRYLGGTTQQFDIIISEPSNPWVAGIENLYSKDFYEIANRKLKPGGIFAQWIHTYSFNDDLLRMVLNTMSQHFPYVSVFQLKGGDQVLIGKLGPVTKEDLNRAEERMAANPAAEKNLKGVHFDSIPTILALEAIPGTVSSEIGRGTRIHTLVSPKLSNLAAKAFFLGKSANLASLRRKYPKYFPSIKDSMLSTYFDGKLPDWKIAEKFKEVFCDDRESSSQFLCEETVVLSRLLKGDYQPEASISKMVESRELATLGLFGKPISSRYTEDDLRKVNDVFEVYKKYASPVANIPIGPLLEQINYCLRTTTYAEELYGECLLQKILILETAFLPGPDLNSSIQQYLEWFPNLDPKSEDYSKLKEARNILTKMFRTSSQKQ